MNAADLFSTAWANLLRRKGRTILTSAGVVIGTLTLVLMVSLGLGLQRQIIKVFESDESLRTLSVSRNSSGDGGKKKSPSPFPFAMNAQMIPITEKDLEEIRKLPDVEAATPELNLFLQVSFEAFDGTQMLPVAGIEPGGEARYKAHLAHGRMWTPGEKACLIPTAYLEGKLHAKPEDVLGKPVRFKGLVKSEAEAEPEDPVVCVGILDSDALGLRGRQVFLPMDLALDLREKKGSMGFFSTKKGAYLAAEVRVTDPRRAQDAAARLRGSGYTVVSAMDMIRQINIVFIVLEGFMAAIGGIGLVVSLFGIANTMAMAVLERTREIGVMKALGARDRDIGRLFLVEAATLGGLGGAVGLALAWLAGKLINVIAHLLQVPADVSLFHVTWWLAAGAVGFAVLVSVVAGTLPARRAARLEPVAALRFE
jgi:putative ABC transport system permease protein